METPPCLQCGAGDLSCCPQGGVGGGKECHRRRRNAPGCASHQAGKENICWELALPGGGLGEGGAPISVVVSTSSRGAKNPTWRGLTRPLVSARFPVSHGSRAHPGVLPPPAPHTPIAACENSRAQRLGAAQPPNCSRAEGSAPPAHIAGAKCSTLPGPQCMRRGQPPGIAAAPSPAVGALRAAPQPSHSPQTRSHTAPCCSDHALMNAISPFAHPSLAWARMCCVAAGKGAASRHRVPFEGPGRLLPMPPHPTGPTGAAPRSYPRSPPPLLRGAASLAGRAGSAGLRQSPPHGYNTAPFPLSAAAAPAGNVLF